ncbi:hypothetical protein [Clostridium cochlearium]|uniref:hypothetical protein n=1 Tax=Clostridium cochlearium TaxID=1494 RepID=UPI000BBC052D|nr:hypothetical protein [Clostridium cochlearium]
MEQKLPTGVKYEDYQEILKTVITSISKCNLSIRQSKEALAMIIQGLDDIKPWSDFKGVGKIDTTTQAIRESLKESGLTAKQALEVLDKCKSGIANEMHLKENFKNKLTW